MSPNQYDPAYLTLAAIPSAPSAGAAKADLSNLADPTKTADHSASFSDVLSALNPLQHIPIVGSIYRAITGDIAPPAARVVGGALLGGPIGVFLSAANAIFEQDSGHEFGSQVLAFLGPNKSKQPGEPAPDIAASADTAATTEARLNTAAMTAAPMVASPVAPSTPLAAAPDTSDAVTAPEPEAAPVATAAAIAPAAPGALKLGAPGRSMADYWSSAGQKAPVIDNSRSGGTPQRAPVPLQLSMPGATDLRQPAVASPASAAATPASAATADKQPSDWVASAMMHGLDRYREMKRREEPSPRASQVDTEL